MAIANLPLPEPQTDGPDWKQAEEYVYRMAAELVTEHAAVLGHLHNTAYKILFRKKPSRRRGRLVIEAIKAFKGLDRYIHPYDFAIMLDWGYWEANPDQRKPILFRALCQCDRDDETGVCAVRQPDAAIYVEEIRLFGPWTPDLKDALAYLEQWQAEQPQLPQSAPTNLEDASAHLAG